MRIARSVTTLFLAAALAGCVVADSGYPPPDDAQAAAYGGPPEINEPPPPLPVYDQPACPEVGYIWTPGLWQWGVAGYTWVPGTWVAPPAVGLLWTPGYWGFANSVYVFHAGYWGPHVGFYGGINYGFGYGGLGYVGGRWAGSSFQYNTAVSNVNVNVIHNTYNQTVVNNINGGAPRPSFAGGPGTRTQLLVSEADAANEAHTPPTAAQVQHQSGALANPALAATRNEGRPPIAATAQPGQFGGAGVMAAKPVGEPYHPAVAPTARVAPSSSFVHARDLPVTPSGSAADAGASAEQRAYEQQRSDLLNRQDQERQALARQQQAEHENFANQPVHDHQAYEAMERQHHQSTAQLQQRHQKEQQQFKSRAPAPRHQP